MKAGITAAMIFVAGTALAQTPPSMRIAGNFSANTKHVDNIEKPFFTGLPKAIGGNFTVNYNAMDVIGVSTTMADLRKAVDAYREVFDQRLQTRFNAKVLTLWPFGPQVFYCNSAIKSLDDMKGLKVR